MCASSGEDGEAHLTCTVEVAIKKNQGFAEPAGTSPEPCTGSQNQPGTRTATSWNCPERNPPPGTSRNPRNPHRNLPQPARNPHQTFPELPGTRKTHRNLQNQPEPAPEAAPNLIWAETPKLTLLEKNSMNTQAVGGVWVNVTTITTTICFLLGREAN